MDPTLLFSVACIAVGVSCIRAYSAIKQLTFWADRHCARITFEVEGTDRDVFKEGGEAPILNEVYGDRKVILARWGLIPKWQKDPKNGPKFGYNARCETLEEKATFREAYQSRRCIIPVTAFFEQDNHRWLKVSARDGGVMGLAGLYEPPYLTKLPTFTMVTTESNDLLFEINDRMPVLLSPSDFDAWLSPKFDPHVLEPLMVKCAPEVLKIEDAGSNRKRAEPPRQDSLF